MEENKAKALALIEKQGLTVLPDNKQWELRFEIHSETSDSVYIVARRISSGEWGCSCLGWRRNRDCKHLKAIDDLLASVDEASPKQLQS